MVKKFIVSIDQGTTSTRSILFNTHGMPVFTSQREFKQLFPKNGWVEHKPQEIWDTTLLTLKEVFLKSKKLRGKVLTIGITNQRETTIIWDKFTGKAIYNAIVWQDRRTANFCESLKKRKKEKIISKKTGLLIDPYFSATKIHWILNNVPKAKKLLKEKKLLFGTVDTFLLWNLTNGKVHATDATNASRTMLFNINSNDWDKDLLKLFEIPDHILPIVKDSSDDYGFAKLKFTKDEIPINSLIGDQQSATVGQSCFDKGSVKSTYGTGCFVLMNTGNKKIISKNRLLTTVCYRLNNKITYALEGSIFIAGAGIQWLRDKIGFIKKASDTENVVKSLKSNGGVYLVPAFTGLGSPYWDSKSRGLIYGLTRDSGPAQIIRAVIESVAYQSYDLFKAMERDGLKPKIVRVDGGMVTNNWFSKFLSDIINIKVDRPRVIETTALGAAYLAGLKIGVFKSIKDIKKNWKIDKHFSPSMSKLHRNTLLDGWTKAIRKTLAN